MNRTNLYLCATYIYIVFWVSADKNFFRKKKGLSAAYMVLAIKQPWRGHVRACRMLLELAEAQNNSRSMS